MYKLRAIPWEILILCIVGLLLHMDLDGGYRQSPGPPEGGAYTVVALRFADMETPVLTSPTILTLKNKPFPSQSLQLFRNGVLMTGGSDYTISNSTLTLVMPTVISEKEKFTAWYRY